MTLAEFKNYIKCFEKKSMASLSESRPIICTYLVLPYVCGSATHDSSLLFRNHSAQPNPQVCNMTQFQCNPGWDQQSPCFVIIYTQVRCFVIYTSRSKLEVTSYSSLINKDNK